MYQTTNFISACWDSVTNRIAGYMPFGNEISSEFEIQVGKCATQVRDYCQRIIGRLFYVDDLDVENGENEAGTGGKFSCRKTMKFVALTGVGLAGAAALSVGAYYLFSGEGHQSHIYP